MALLSDLLSASFRGIPFHVFSATETSGRRNQRYDFPGRDEAAFEDLGAVDGPMRFTGILIGDDVILQMEALRAALRLPGPGRLIHPWAGEMQAVVAPGSLPEFSFDEREGRVARITMSFERVGEPPLLRRLMASGVAALGAFDASIAWLGGLSPLGALHLASQLHTLGEGLARSLLRRRSHTPALEKVVNTVRRLAASPSEIKSELPALGPALVTALTPRPTPALAGVERADPLAPAQARGATLALLEVAALLPPGVGLILTAAATEVAPALAYDSRQEALALRDRLVQAADALARAVSLLLAQPWTKESGETNALPLLWSSALALRNAALADMSERAGTLPPILDWQPRAGTSALLGLQRLYGDDPRQLLGRLDDLVRRNPSLRHPGALGPDVLEVLDR